MYKNRMNPEESHKVFYDTIVGGNNYSPCTEPNLRACNARYAPNVYNNWNTSHFGKCLWQVENYTNSTIIDNLSFPDPSSFVNWKNSRIPNSGGRFTEEIVLKPYDIVDNRIPAIDTIYGMNTVYASLKNGKYYKSGKPQLGDGGRDAPEWMASFLKAIVDNYFPLTAWHPDRDVTAYQEGGAGRHLIWTGRNWSKLYSMPKIGERIITSNSGWADRRSFIDENYEGINPESSGRTFNFSSPIVWIVDPNSGTWRDYTISPPDMDAIKYSILSPTGMVGLVTYKLTTGPTGTEPYCAVYMKPMGIDVVWINYIDTSKYDLEVVYFVRDSQKLDFKKITNLWRPNRLSGRVGILKQDWIATKSRYKLNLSRSKGVRHPEIYFRLRDKETNRVGRLSNARIHCYLDHTNAPVKFIVV